jgi:putative ABC transport system substrate-binding protein
MFFALALLTTEEARAQEPAKVHQIGYLITGSPAESANRVKALRLGLEDHGYVEGRNIILVFRFAETADRLPVLAADLVRLKVDLIFANSSTEVEAVRKVTTTIPIVFATHADPVGVGHVVSLARPGGNITGMSMLLTELVAKELEIMKQALPHMTRLGVVLTLTAPSHRPASHAVAAAAPTARDSDPYSAGANIRGPRWGVRDDGARTCAWLSLRGIAALSLSPQPSC